MAIPFNIPGEQNDTDLLLNQRLLDLYNLLYQILLQRQPLTVSEQLQTVVTETAQEVTQLDTPFVDYEVRSQVKRKKLRHYKNKEPSVVTDGNSAPSRPIYHDWTQVGRNLRQIADNFHYYNNTQSYADNEQVDYYSTDLLTTIVSLSPFRDSIWSAVFVVGCRMLSNSMLENDSDNDPDDDSDDDDDDDTSNFDEPDPDFANLSDFDEFGIFADIDNDSDTSNDSPKMDICIFVSVENPSDFEFPDSSESADSAINMDENLAPVINVHLSNNITVPHESRLTAIADVNSEPRTNLTTTIIDNSKHWLLPSSIGSQPQHYQRHYTTIDHEPSGYFDAVESASPPSTTATLCNNPRNLSLSSSPVSRRRPMLAYGKFLSLSEPRLPVIAKEESIDVPLDTYDLEAWDLDAAVDDLDPKDVLDTTPLSSSTELSFPSPFLDSSTFLRTSTNKSTTKTPSPKYLSPLKSTLSDWWIASSTLLKPKTEQHTFQTRPFDFSDDDVLISGDPVGIASTTLAPPTRRPSTAAPRPKSMLDQYLPVLNESISVSKHISDLPSLNASKLGLETDPYLTLEPIPTNYATLEPTTTIDQYSPRSLLFEDDLKKPEITTLPGPSTLLDAAPKPSLLTPTNYRVQIPRKHCMHEIIDFDTENDLNRTYFWRKAVVSPSKVSLDYHLPQEAPEEYCYGGYEKVDIGHVYLDRYLIIRKIGWGHFSTVWLAGDKLLKRLVAIKIVKSGKVFSETAQDEISLLCDVSIVGSDNSRFDYFVKIYDQFEFYGDNGKHKAIVFELLGCNLYKLTTLTLGVGVDLTYVKIITKQVLEGLIFLHEECGIIHTDIKPENILIAGSPEYHRKVVLNVARWLKVDMPWPKQFVCNWNEDEEYVLSEQVKKEIKEFLTSIHIPRCSCHNDQYNHKEFIRRLEEILNDENTRFTKDHQPEISVFHVPSPKNLRIKIADLGNACYDHSHFCDQIQTCQYRGPETILGARYTYSADIWSLACVVFELAAGDYLFDPRASTRGDYSCDDDHLAHMIELLGPMPEHVWKRGKWSNKFFTNDGKLRRIATLNPWSIEQVLEEKYEFSVREAAEFASFLKPMLDYDPKTRVSARECLKHPWLSTV